MMKKIVIFGILTIIFGGSTILAIMPMGIAILIASFPTQKIIQHDLSWLDSMKGEVGVSPSLDETEQSLNNGIHNLSLINEILIPVIVSPGVLFVIFFKTRKILQGWKLTSKLSESSSVLIAILFGLMVLFYTSADMTNTSKDQTSTQMLGTIIASEKKHDEQIKLLGDFILTKDGQYRQNIINAAFFGIMASIGSIIFIWNKIKPDSIIPYLLLYSVIGSLIIWTFVYVLNISPSTTPAGVCIKVHC